MALLKELNSTVLLGHISAEVLEGCQ